MFDYDSCVARRVLPSDIKLILDWRNHPSTRKFMLNQNIISAGEHKLWFEETLFSHDRLLLIVEDLGSPIGSVHFKGLDSNCGVEWSFQSAPSSPKGSGIKVCASALNYLFQNSIISEVYGYVLDFNAASLNLHERLGFVTLKSLSKSLLVGGKAVGLVGFMITRDKWFSSCN